MSVLSNTADEIRGAAQDIRSFAKEAPQHFQSLQDKLDYLSQSFGTMTVSETPAMISEKKEDAAIHINDIQFKEVLLKLQFAAMGVLYLFEQSYRKGINIDGSVFEKVHLNSAPYGVGVLTVFEAIGLISFKVHLNTLIPASCSQVVMNNTRNELQSFQAFVNKDRVELLIKIMTAIDEHIVRAAHDEHMGK